MNFDLTGTDKALLTAIGEILADEGLAPLSEMEDASPDQIANSFRPWLQRLGKTGYLADQAGGRGCGLLVAQEALASTCSALMILAESVVRLPSMIISRFGTDELENELLTDLHAGRRICAVAAAEPGSGSAPKAYATVARKDGDGYVLDGVKSPVSLGSVADAVVVLAQLDDAVVGFLVDGTAEGLSTSDRMQTLGHGILAPVQIHLEGVRASSANMLTGETLLDELRNAEDRMVIATGLGLMTRAYEEAVKASGAERDSGKPPAGNQLVRFETAEMLMLCQTAELLAMRSASDGSEVVALCAKVFVTEAACRVTEMAMQISAAAGYIKPSAIERCFREARLGTIVGHTSEVARMAIADDSLARVV